ncbi:serine/threonine-protein kinase/endoribonuclease IRE1a-like isoform X2 [Alnus glutinosa]|uniref:serine/threonine-protein kinase/endoribonuclease IRE1a-like isoform X2 n=1 Tax=Alnus glutinosa TaxID=3517 RepID=UPI002D7942E4|nr:serine/threonine-protein kinase/endoribonuclease IRE1a-like isoform X2 [Alnus glutinosa]
MGMAYLEAQADLSCLSHRTPIYTSYQAPFSEDNDKENASGPNGRFFIDCGDDWDLHMHTQNYGRMKLSMSIDEFVKNTPYISEDGAVTLGSKKTTVFEVDLRTGKLIRTYRFDPPSTLRSDETRSVSYYDTADKELVKSGPKNPDIVDLRLHITRTDYTLTSFARDSEKTSWNMTIAEVGASLLCLDASSGAPLNFPDNPGSEIGIDFAIPLSCHTRGPVFCHRSHTLPESSRSERLPMPPSGLMIPTQPKVDEFVDIQHENVMLPSPTPNSILPLRPKTNIHRRDDREAMLPLPPMEIDDTGIVDVHGMRISLKHVLSMFFEWSTALSIILFVIILVVGLVVKGYVWVIKEQALLNEQPGNSGSKTASSKRKKNRKSGKNVSSENGDVFVHVDGENKMSSHLDKLVDGSIDGRRIGKLIVSNTEIAKGSNGTIVLEGNYEGRPVAVKRLVQAHNDVAFKEIQNLIASDRHPNIVRWYGVEYDQDFVYLSLERCTYSLDDLIHISLHCSQYPMFNKDQATRGMIEYKARLDSKKDIMSGLNLWKANGYPSPLLLKIMRDMVSGLVHLHELGIIHRDLKPQNVLIINESSVCAKLSDMGISKRLVENMSSLGHHATGCGSSGWQAPEQLLHGRQTRAVDLFSLGCVIFFCITGGRHPFGNHLERDINIVKNQMDLFLVEHIPEALDLISRLLNPDPELRPKASAVLHHPLFWSSEMRLTFLRDTSDRVELEDRETHSNLLQALERIGLVALGGKWDEKMETAFITNIGRYRRYKFDSVRDLLRVMRNKLNHYRELPKEIQELVGPVPEGYDNYFASRFPRLLIQVYKVIYRYCREEECFQKYFKTNAC